MILRIQYVFYKIFKIFKKKKKVNHEKYIY